MPVNREKAMADFVSAITRMDMVQLVIANKHLSEHIFNVWQYKIAQNELQKHKEKPQ